ncbi:hypothetical protein BUY49_02325 [Staphylococcus devriesei]|uniref:hypothetical protein n=1 Tax=Staphylococcus devriesei TaxID=586733 RepID=UPI000E68BEBD|nr:hypothetical protein [Staphylococcus devriesei]RIL72735.1 hypothetical protein BUY49_02325 [Staphylococcus devriesei]
MDRNTVNIDLREYRELLIKAYKYEESQSSKNLNSDAEYEVVASYSPDTCYIEVEGEVDFNKLKKYRENHKRMIITFK